MFNCQYHFYLCNRGPYVRLAFVLNMLSSWNKDIIINIIIIIEVVVGSHLSRLMTKPTTSEDSDQPGHPPSLIRVFAVHLKKAWVLSYPLSAQRRLWSDWADAQADLSLRWAHMSFCWFCHEAAQFFLVAFLVSTEGCYLWLWHFMEWGSFHCLLSYYAIFVRNKHLYQDNSHCCLSRVLKKCVYAICEQQRRRAACASTSLCSCAGWFVSYLVATPEDGFSRDEANLSARLAQSAACNFYPWHES